ncbi:MAG: 2-oxoacid:acceptor oxidoreductase family protein [Candidatus Methanomethylicia archaeon]|nr:2-oxoacid:acceptor oxidoreductase family protein [Candidatus Methanomethylicia archaeon]
MGRELFLEIRLHGRGGQGVVTASEMLAEAAILEGYHGQSIPYFGAERRGAPVVASARISDAPVRKHSQVYRPDVISVFDTMFVLRKDVREGLKEGGTVVVNHKKVPKISNFKVYSVNATKIALENGLIVAGWAVVNTAMVGATAKALGVISKVALESVVRKRWRGDLAERNLRAALRAFEEVGG